MKPEAWIVVDLGFGDAGKGTITDFLVRQRKASMVLRFNGGAQAGHNVVTPDGRHHTFSQFGSGSFVSGVRTHLMSSVVIDPLALLVEADHLEKKGVKAPLERLSVDGRALVITPYQRALNRLREMARGDSAHGTCGIGFGETVWEGLNHPELVIRAADLYRPAALYKKLDALRQSALERSARIPWVEAPRAAVEREVLSDPRSVDAWLDGIARLINQPLLKDDETLPLSESVVFEGAQGVLLDEWRGFHPYTTWSTCTPANAVQFLQARGFEGTVSKIGVLRSYQTRHGAGPFPSETTPFVKEEVNDERGWQGAFRQGRLDLVLLRYALEVSPVDHLAVTHLDHVPLEPWPVCGGYERPSGERMQRLVPGPFKDLEYQAQLTALVEQVRPVLEKGPAVSEFGNWLEEQMGVPVKIESSGVTWKEKRWLTNGKT